MITKKVFAGSVLILSATFLLSVRMVAATIYASSTGGNYHLAIKLIGNLVPFTAIVLLVAGLIVLFQDLYFSRESGAR